MHGLHLSSPSPLFHTPIAAPPLTVTPNVEAPGILLVLILQVDDLDTKIGVNLVNVNRINRTPSVVHR